MRRKGIGLAALLLAALIVLGGCGKLKEPAAAPTEAFTLTTAAPEETGTQETTGTPEETGVPEETEAPAATKAQKKTAAPTATKAPKKTAAPTETPPEEAGPITDPQAVADYIFAHGELPDNFITKEEAKALGWDSTKNYVGDVAPGKSIGGDRYGNYEGLLPKAKGRKFYECDVNYTGRKRGAERLIYSSDGRVWYTKDHYETFEELFPSDR